MSKKKVFLFIILLVVFVAVLGGSYAIIQLTVKGIKENTITAGTLSLNLEEENVISVNNAYPLTESEGEETKPYKFTLTNDGNITSNYTISLIDVDDISGKIRMLDDYIKCRLQISGSKERDIVMKLSDLGRTLDTGTIKAGESNNYILNIWIDYDAPNEAQQTVFKAKLNISGEQTIK